MPSFTVTEVSDKVRSYDTDHGARCECGCGELVTIHRGKPRRFVVNHHWRMPRKPERYRVDADTGCWVWLLGQVGKGYGQTGANGKRARAHRVYYERYNGPIPAGLVIDHLCRNRLCVNPVHLGAVTQAENLRRGRKARLA